VSHKFNVGKTALMSVMRIPFIETFLATSSLVVRIAYRDIDDTEEFRAELFNCANAGGIVQVCGDENFLHQGCDPITGGEAGFFGVVVSPVCFVDFVSKMTRGKSNVFIIAYANIEMSDVFSFAIMDPKVISWNKSFPGITGEVAPEL